MITVRRADADDWRAARDVRLRALADSPGAFASTLAREQRFDEAEWRHRMSTSAWFLARAEEDAVGDPVGNAVGDPVGNAVEDAVGVAVGIDDPDASDARHLVSMWVDPVHRGHGVADDLLAAVAHWAAGDGAVDLALWVVDGNPRARRFYERLGFVGTGERAPLPSDPSVMESRMIRPLDTERG